MRSEAASNVSFLLRQCCEVSCISLCSNLASMPIYSMACQLEFYRLY